MFGLIRLCQLALPGIRAQGSCTIVNLGSAGADGLPGSSAYDMTTWSLEALSDALRVEVCRFGVRVVLLEPGGVPTNFAAVVLKAVRARNPRARSKIGMPPRIMPLLYRALPNRAWDALVSRLFPMTEGPGRGGTW